MPYAAGVFSLVAGNPVVTGTIVSSTWANNTLTDIAVGLSTAVLKDGTQTMTAPIPFAQGISGALTVGTSLNWGSGVASYGKVSKRTIADQTIAVTAMTNVTALSFAIGANEEWQAKYLVAISSVSTPGYFVLVSTPTGATQNVSEISFSGVATNTLNGDVTVNATVPFRLGAEGSAPNQTLADISLWVLNGVNAGTVNVQFGQATATTSGFIVRKGSHMYATRLA